MRTKVLTENAKEEIIYSHTTANIISSDCPFDLKRFQFSFDCDFCDNKAIVGVDLR